MRRFTSETCLQISWGHAWGTAYGERLSSAWDWLLQQPLLQLLASSHTGSQVESPSLPLIEGFLG